MDYIRGRLVAYLEGDELYRACGLMVAELTKSKNLGFEVGNIDAINNCIISPDWRAFLIDFEFWNKL